MPNTEKFKNNDRLFKLKNDYIKETIKETIEEDLKGKHSVIYQNLIEYIVEAIVNIDKPNFKNNQENFRDKFFDSDTLSTIINNIVSDIQNITAQSNNFQNILKKNKQYSEIINEKLEKDVKESDNILNDIRTNKNKEAFNISENFNDKNNIDNNSDAYINSKRSFSTLKIKDRHTDLYNNKTEIQIKEDSNGYPGRLFELVNTQEKETSYYLSTFNSLSEDNIKENIKGPMFYKAQDRHIHAARAIDGDEDSWFEYEICNFPHEDGISNQNTEIEQGTNLYGAFFENGEMWAKEPTNNKLLLHLELILDEQEDINYIEIDKHQIDNKNYKMPTLKTIKLANDTKTTPESIPFISDNYDNDKITIHFPSTETQVIHFVFEQTEKYKCIIGHKFYKALSKSVEETQWFEYKGTDKIDGKRIQGPKTDIDNIRDKASSSLKDLPDNESFVLNTGEYIPEGSDLSYISGVLGEMTNSILSEINDKYDNLNNAGLDDIEDEIHQEALDKLGHNYTEEDLEEIREQINSEYDLENIMQGIDILNGWRYAIALKNIKIGRNIYKEKSQIVSENYQIPGTINSIELKADEFLPNKFYNNETEETDYSNKGDWIEYYFTLDDGENWHRIAPEEDHYSSINNKYYINTSFKELDYNNKNVEFIDIENIKNFKYKVVFNRPTEVNKAEELTPKLNNIDFIIETKAGGLKDEY